MNGTVKVIAVHTVECEGEVYRPGDVFFLPERALSALISFGSVRLFDTAVEPALVAVPAPKVKRRYTRRTKG